MKRIILSLVTIVTVAAIATGVVSSIRVNTSSRKREV